MSVPNSISSCLTIQIKYLILSNPILWYTTPILAKNEAETSIANMLEYLIYNIFLCFVVMVLMNSYHSREIELWPPSCLHVYFSCRRSWPHSMSSNISGNEVSPIL